MVISSNFVRGGGLSEYFDVLDDQGNKTGQTKLRSEVHRDGDWHRAVFVVIINDRGEILMQRRAAHKDSHPNLLDLSCGGHLVAGEDSLHGAISELYEELGIKVRPEDLTYLFSDKSSTRPHPGFINNSFYDFYLLRGDYEVSELKLQAEEVSEVIWLPLTDLKTAIAEHNPDFVPDSGLYKKLFERLGV